MDPIPLSKIHPIAIKKRLLPSIGSRRFACKAKMLPASSPWRYPVLQQTLIGKVSSVLAFAFLREKSLGDQIIRNRTDYISFGCLPALLLFELGKSGNELTEACFASSKNETNQLSPLLSP